MISKEEFLIKVGKLVKKYGDEENIKRLKWWIPVVSSLLVIFGFALLIYFLIINRLTLSILAIAIVVVGIVFLVRYNKNKKLMKYRYKDKALRVLLKGYKYRYYMDDYIYRSTFLKSQFLSESMVDEMSGEDLLIIRLNDENGKASNTSLTISDIVTYSIAEDKDGNKTAFKKYSGVYGYIDFEKNFNCRLCINSKYKIKKVKFEKVELESIAFNEIFSIKSDNQVEARYILTPELMESLMLLDKKVSGLKLTLVDNIMHIGFDGDLFKMGNYQGSLESVFGDFYDDISLILSIIENISSNPKVFSI